MCRAALLFRAGLGQQVSLQVVGCLQLLQHHQPLTLNVCANILTTLLRTHGVELLTEADVRANAAGREVDTRYTLLVHTIMYRASSVLEQAHGLRAHLMGGMPSSLLFLALTRASFGERVF